MVTLKNIINLSSKFFRGHRKRGYFLEVCGTTDGLEVVHIYDPPIMVHVMFWGVVYDTVN